MYVMWLIDLVIQNASIKSLESHGIGTPNSWFLLASCPLVLALSLDPGLDMLVHLGICGLGKYCHPFRSVPWVIYWWYTCWRSTQKSTDMDDNRMTNDYCCLAQSITHASPYFFFKSRTIFGKSCRSCQAWGENHHKRKLFNILSWTTEMESTETTFQVDHCKHLVPITNQQPFPTLSIFVLAILLQDCVDALFGGFGRIMFVVELLSDRGLSDNWQTFKRCRLTRPWLERKIAAPASNASRVTMTSSRSACHENKPTVELLILGGWFCKGSHIVSVHYCVHNMYVNVDIKI